MLITPEVARDIARIIRDHHAAVAAALFGPDAVSPETWQLAIDLGLVADPDNWEPVLGTLHELGAVLAHLDQSMVSDRYGATLADLKAEIARHPIPRTAVEHHAAQWFNQNGARYITDLGDRAATQTVRLASGIDRVNGHTLRSKIRDVIGARFGDDAAQQRLTGGVPDSVFNDLFRASIRETSAVLAHATQDWARDMQRIAQTESHNAISEGIAEAWLSQETDTASREGQAPRRLLAFKLPRPEACKHCRRLHVKGDLPRLYWLDEIQGNGTNVGRSASEWRAVVGATHPWCGCTLHRVPFALVEKITNTKGWRSGEPAPRVIGPGGTIVMEKD